jgi:alkanesulfonate monooxygenase SsuD/methylene tetrahydromethanopterin reductase-like flavin-dependent oxidoreductase (luciferase family)
MHWRAGSGCRVTAKKTAHSSISLDSSLTARVTFGSERSNFCCAIVVPDATRSAKHVSALAAANHPQDVVDDCLRWCTHDWLSVVVAKTDDEAKALEKEAQAEQLAIRGRFAKKYGRLDGPVIRPKPGQSTAELYVGGGDMSETITGSPETIAHKVAELVDLGINHLLLRFIGEWTGNTRYICENSAQLFAREVMPLFKSRLPIRDPCQAPR